MGSQRVRHDWATFTFTFFHFHTLMFLILVNGIRVLSLKLHFKHSWGLLPAISFPSYRLLSIKKTNIFIPDLYLHSQISPWTPKRKCHLSCVWLLETLYSPWNSPGQNTGVGSSSLLQWIFPTQRSNSGLPHCRWIIYQLSCQGSPRMLELQTWILTTYSVSKLRCNEHLKDN